MKGTEQLSTLNMLERLWLSKKSSLLLHAIVFVVHLKVLLRLIVAGKVNKKLILIEKPCKLDVDW